VAVSALRSNSLPVPPPAPAGKRQIAVLRFDNRTGQPDLDWLRDGVPDMLAATPSPSRTLNDLSREQLLLWMDRSGASGLTDVLEVARRSHAESAIIGSFARVGNSIRVDARAYDGHRVVGSQTVWSRCCPAPTSGFETEARFRQRRRSRKAGIPNTPVASLTARKTAMLMTSAAMAPMTP
jgi:TolB-like protein